MTSINLMGAYSGIDMSVIDQLVEAEKAKGVKFTNRKQDIERERSAWKDVNSRLDNLHKKLDTLTKTETFQSRTVTSNVKESNELNVTANDTAAIGTYHVKIQQLATSSRLTGSQVNVDSIYDNIEGLSGDFVINYGLPASPTDVANFKNPEEYEKYLEGKSLEVKLEEGKSYSLKDIETLINQQIKETGIQASIIDRRLVLTDTTYGDRKIEVSGDLAGELGLIEANLSLGQEAVFTVNGVEIMTNTNTVDDVVEGLTIELISAGADEVITVSQDAEKTTKAVKEFIDQYNSTVSFLKTQTDVGNPSAEGNETGALAGDGTIMRLQSSLRSILTGTVTDGIVTGDVRSIEDLGIEIDRYGVASFDESKFNEVLQEDSANVARFFYRQDNVEIPEENRVEGEPTTKTQRDGVSELLKNFIDTYISSKDGVITNKNDTYDRMLKDIEQQIETFNERVDRKRDRYIQQFTALDIAMMQAQSQLDYMYSQLGIEAQ